MKKEDFIEDLNELRENGAFDEMQNEWLDAIDKAIIYIEELEKYKRKHSLIKNHYIGKDEIKDKIEELEEEDLEIYDTDSEDLIIAKYEQRAVLDFAQQLLNDKEEKCQL